MSFPTIEQLNAIVIPAAQRELVPHFGSMDYEYKEDGSVITKADIAMQLALVDGLQNSWPEYAILGEEMTDDEQQAVLNSNTGYWCIDPLDGTNNYATGMPFFAVSIALIIDGVAQLGYIYDPLRDEVFSAIKGKGAQLNGQHLNHKPIATDDNKVIAEIDMKRLPSELATRLVTSPPYGSQRNIGSSALDWCWLAAGRYNVYLHGGQKLWDYAAGHLICAEAGGSSISLDGEPVFRNLLETRSVLASLDAELFERWKQWVGIPVGV
jgi:myo-inositol-1(or 4)-monophosphatase